MSYPKKQSNNQLTWHEREQQRRDQFFSRYEEKISTKERKEIFAKARAELKTKGILS